MKYLLMSVTDGPSEIVSWRAAPLPDRPSVWIELDAFISHTVKKRKSCWFFFNKGDLLGEWISCCICNFVVIISFPLCWWIALLSFQNTVVHLSCALQVSEGGNWECQVLVWILWHLKLQLHWEVKRPYTSWGTYGRKHITERLDCIPPAVPLLYHAT